MKNGRVRVLLLAEQCNPDWPSLPVVGYKLARALAEKTDTVLVTQIRNRPQIERAGVGAAEVVYLDTERLAAPLYKLSMALRRGDATGWTIQVAMTYPSYIAFELLAWYRFRRHLAAGHFDVVHRITPMSPAIPSPLARLTRVPFVLGPLNGNLAWPPQFRQEKSREREWLSSVRNAYKSLPFSRSTFHRAAAILAAFKHTMADLPRADLERAVNFPEVGIDPELFSPPNRLPRERMTILFAGRLVPYKLPEVVVRAFARSEKLRQHRLVVVGDGPELPRLEAIVAENHLESCVELVGQKTQAEVGEIMRQAEVFAFPSIRELGAGVVVEAMACGMASVVVDYGAPGALIASDRGVKVPLGDRDELVERFTTELERLVSDPQRVRTLGENAHKHALENYAWDVKARETLAVYDWVLKRRDTKPNFYP